MSKELAIYLCCFAFHTLAKPVNEILIGENNQNLSSFEFDNSSDDLSLSYDDDDEIHKEKLLENIKTKLYEGFAEQNASEESTLDDNSNNPINPDDLHYILNIYFHTFLTCAAEDLNFDEIVDDSEIILENIKKSAENDSSDFSK
ncbi:hypothetical protein FQR65_LT04072 [Abscondita terminalis]|nr:hypothetical protein FQR65_LT04072 [Abscondita terminalis]